MILGILSDEMLQWYIIYELVDTLLLILLSLSLQVLTIITNNTFLVSC
jgi:hypothetical protein